MLQLNSKATLTASANFSLGNTQMHTTNYSFTEGFKLQYSVKAGIPGNEVSGSSEFSFSATQVSIS
jgi:hypothetical protein